MTRALPPLGWFRAFEAAARRLSFTAAAEELGLTQSAISQQVRLLEDRLEVVLFQRKPRGLAITDDGRRLLPKVTAALGQLAEATAEFETGSSERLLTVAASVSVLQWIIAPRLAEFAALHPDVRIRLLSTVWPDDFRAPLADVEIRFGSEALVGQGAERLLPDTLIAVADPSLAQGWHDAPLIETVGTSGAWQDWARAAMPGFAPAPTLFVDSYGAALDLAVNGAGVALCSSLLSAGPLREERLVQVHPAALFGKEGYFLAQRSEKDSAVAFAGWVRSAVEVA